MFLLTEIDEANTFTFGICANNLDSGTWKQWANLRLFQRELAREVATPPGAFSRLGGRNLTVICCFGLFRSAVGKEKRRLQLKVLKTKAILVCVTSRVEGKQKILITQPEPCLAAEFSLTSVSGVSTVSADCNEKGVCVGWGGAKKHNYSWKAFTETNR